jgi:uncharacterized protein YndB with AHSA1/START domain
MTDEMTFRELDIVRVFDAPRDLVWRAWTDPDQIALWWGPAGMHTPRETVEMDVRPGGVFRLTMVAADGTEFPSDMHFTAVDPPETLAFAWGDQRGLGGGSSSLTFKDLGGGKTELVNHFAGYLTDVISGYMVQGTNEQFDKLGVYLSRA